MIRRLCTLAIAVVAFSLTACANDAGGDGAAAPAPVSSAPALPSDPGVPTGEPSGGPVDSSSKTVSGVVEAGVEPGCLLLDEHLLIFDDPALKADAEPGSSVTVTGSVQEGTMTTCMQGTPFLVTSVRAN